MISKGYLLDTSVALVAIDEPERLSFVVRSAVEEGPAFLSVISYWEVMIKSMKGSLDVGDPRRWWSETLTALSLFPLSYRPEHVEALHALPPIHNDPFDRALISQAMVEELVLVTTDGIIPRYASDRFHALV